MVELSLFPRNAFKRKPQEYREAALTDFSGGLNTRDNPFTTRNSYAPAALNCAVNEDGSFSIRFGSHYKADLFTDWASGQVIEVINFKGFIIAVAANGKIAKVDTTTFVSTVIWSSAIAALLPGAPSGWSSGLAKGSIDSSEFKGSLIVTNFVDKPLIIDSSFVVKYLQDPATGSNVNTPSGHFVTTVSNYLVMAGVTAAPNDIYVSSAGTSGVWPGDPAPNDSISISIGSYVPENSGNIVGLAAFRNFLIVAFPTSIVVVQLGVYEGVVHTPNIQDNIIEHGVLNHRCFVTTKNDLIMASTLGWHVASRNTYGEIETTNISEIINTGSFGYIANIPASSTEKGYAFLYRDPLDNRIIMGHPDGNDIHPYTLKSLDKDRIKSPKWSRFDGDVDCACATDDGRVYFVENGYLFQQGNNVYADEDYGADFEGSAYTAYQPWATATEYRQYSPRYYGTTVYAALIAHTSGVDFLDDLAAGYWTEISGFPIIFYWENMWSSIGHRSRQKFLRTVHVDTTGQAEFTLQLFVDGVYTFVEQPTATSIDTFDHDDAALSMRFIARDGVGFGDGAQAYGAGRRTADERSYELPIKFKQLKLRVVGTTYEPLRILGFNLLYWLGGFIRK